MTSLQSYINVAGNLAKSETSLVIPDNYEWNFLSFMGCEYCFSFSLISFPFIETQARELALLVHLLMNGSICVVFTLKGSKWSYQQMQLKNWNGSVKWVEHVEICPKSFWMHTTSWIIFFKNLDISELKLVCTHHYHISYFEEYKFGK